MFHLSNLLYIRGFLTITNFLSFFFRFTTVGHLFELQSFYSNGVSTFIFFISKLKSSKLSFQIKLVLQGVLH